MDKKNKKDNIHESRNHMINIETCRPLAEKVGNQMNDIDTCRPKAEKWEVNQMIYIDTCLPLAEKVRNENKKSLCL